MYFFFQVIAGLVVIYTLMLTPQITPPSSLSSQTPPGHPEFVGVDSKYVCVLCNNVLQDAVQTPCGHRLCQPCVDTYLQDGQPRPCPYQEEFCEILQADQVSRGSAHFVPIDIWNLYAIAILLNLFMVIYFFFTNGCLCIFFYIAHCRMLFECTLSSFLFPPTRVSKKYISVKLFVWKMAFILITLGLIWFIFGLYSFLRVFVGYTLTFNKVSRSRL